MNYGRALQASYLTQAKDKLRDTLAGSTDVASMMRAELMTLRGES